MTPIVMELTRKGTTYFMSNEHFKKLKPVHRVKSTDELQKKLTKESTTRVYIKIVSDKKLLEMKKEQDDFLMNKK